MRKGLIKEKNDNTVMMLFSDLLDSVTDARDAFEFGFGYEDLSVVVTESFFSVGAFHDVLFSS